MLPLSRRKDAHRLAGVKGIFVVLSVVAVGTQVARDFDCGGPLESFGDRAPGPIRTSGAEVLRG